MISNQNRQLNTSKKLPTIQEIEEWLVSYLAQILEINSDDIQINIPFDRYRLDSVAAVALISDLEEWLEWELNPTIIYDYPTIEVLAQHLSIELERVCAQ